MPSSLFSRTDWPLVRSVAAVALVVALGAGIIAYFAWWSQHRAEACAASGAVPAASGEWQCVRPDGQVIQP